MANQDGLRSIMMTQFPRHVTSSSHFVDVKGDSFRRTIYSLSLIVIVKTSLVLPWLYGNTESVFYFLIINRCYTLANNPLPTQEQPPVPDPPPLLKFSSCYHNFMETRKACKRMLNGSTYVLKSFNGFGGQKYSVRSLNLLFIASTARNWLRNLFAYRAEFSL